MFETPAQLLYGEHDAGQWGIESGCDASRANGWGGGTVYGTVAFESGMSNLNSNTELFYNARAGGAQPPPLPPGADPARVQRLAGSWKDWN